MKIALVLALSVYVYAQSDGRLDPVMGVPPSYEEQSATEAFLSSPRRVLSAGAGGFYFSEPGNHLIRVNSDGRLTLFGSVPLPSTGDADTDGAGNYFYSTGTGIRRISTSGTAAEWADLTNHPALRLSRPSSIASHRGGVTLYVSNSVGLFLLPGGTGLPGNTRLARRMYHGHNGLYWIESSGRVAQGPYGVVAGSGQYGDPADGDLATEAKFRTLSDILVDDRGRVYVADSEACAVYRIDDGKITRIAGLTEGPEAQAGGNAREFRFRSVDSLAFDAMGRLLIADPNAGTVWRVDDDLLLSRAAGKPRDSIGAPGETDALQPGRAGT